MTPYAIKTTTRSLKCVSRQLLPVWPLSVLIVKDGLERKFKYLNNQFTRLNWYPSALSVSQLFNFYFNNLITTVLYTSGPYLALVSTSGPSQVVTFSQICPRSLISRLTIQINKSINFISNCNIYIHFLIQCVDLSHFLTSIDVLRYVSATKGRINEYSSSRWKLELYLLYLNKYNNVLGMRADTCEGGSYSKPTVHIQHAVRNI